MICTKAKTQQAGARICMQHVRSCVLQLLRSHHPHVGLPVCEQQDAAHPLLASGTICPCSKCFRGSVRGSMVVPEASKQLCPGLQAQGNPGRGAAGESQVGCSVRQQRTLHRVHC